MSSYSKKERAVASLLSKFPKVKSFMKRIYTGSFYFIYKAKYECNIDSNYKITEVDSSSCDNFFGYYDKSPESPNGKYIIYQRVSGGTNKSVCKTSHIEVVVIDRESSRQIICFTSNAFNWQQGTKLQWLNDNCFIFNDYDHDLGRYISKVVDVKLGKIVNTLPMPVYDTYSGEFALSTSFERLSVFAPDYGYFAKDAEVKEYYDHDGVYWICLKTNTQKIIITLEEVSNFKFATPDKAIHTINHIMISPSGNEFIFIHRWYVEGQRFDRLLISDLEGDIRILADEDMVSHCCWVDEYNVIGFLRNNSSDSYFSINVKTNDILPFGSKDYSDGHPTAIGDSILTDTYPNRRGLQELLFLDAHGNTLVLGEFRHSPAYFSENRCDLHPRLNATGDRIYFDSVFSGIRKLYYIEKK